MSGRERRARARVERRVVDRAYRAKPAPSGNSRPGRALTPPGTRYGRPVRRAADYRASASTFRCSLHTYRKSYCPIAQSPNRLVARLPHASTFLDFGATPGASRNDVPSIRSTPDRRPARHQRPKAMPHSTPARSELHPALRRGTKRPARRTLRLPNRWAIGRKEAPLVRRQESSECRLRRAPHMADPRRRSRHAAQKRSETSTTFAQRSSRARTTFTWSRIRPARCLLRPARCLLRPARCPVSLATPMFRLTPIDSITLMAAIRTNESRDDTSNLRGLRLDNSGENMR